MENSQQNSIRRMFDSYDDNNNGILDREEFSKVLKSMIRKLAYNQTEEELDLIEKEAIEKFDLNKNGIIEFEEFNDLVRFLIDEKGLSIDNY